MKFLICYLYERNGHGFIYGNSNFKFKLTDPTLKDGMLTEAALDVIRDHLQQLNELRHKESIVILNIIKLAV